MWPIGAVVFLAHFVNAADPTVCSMTSLPPIDGEYIHYVLTWDCQLTVTRGWDGNSLAEFNIASNKLHLCKPDGKGNPMHYVQDDPESFGQVPHLVFIIYFRQENGTNLHSWRIVRINITEITYRKRFRRTILDSILTEYSTLYTEYPIQTCTYHTMRSIYCLWQKGSVQWAQVYNATENNYTGILEYRAGAEAYFLEGNAIFGKVVGSLPGAVPRALMFDHLTSAWLYEMPMLLNWTVAGRRIQEMRQTGKIKGRLAQVAAMGIQSFIADDCNDLLCKYQYSSLTLVAKARTTCVFTSPFDVVSGVFELSRNLLPVKPRLVAPNSESLLSPPTRQPAVSAPPMLSTGQKQTQKNRFFLEYSMVIIYAITVAIVLIVKLSLETHILLLPPAEIPEFEKSATAFYLCIFPGLTMERQ